MTRILVLEDGTGDGTGRQVVFVDGVRLPSDAGVEFRDSPAIPGHHSWEWDEISHKATPSVDVDVKWENCNLEKFVQPIEVDWITWVDHMQSIRFKTEEPQAHWIKSGDKAVLSLSGVVNGAVRPGARFGALMPPEDVLKVIPTDILREHLEQRQRRERSSYPVAGARLEVVEAFSLHKDVRVTATRCGNFWALKGLVRHDATSGHRWVIEADAYVHETGEPMEVPEVVLESVARMVNVLKRTNDARISAMRELAQTTGLHSDPPEVDPDEDAEEWEESWVGDEG